MTKETSLLGIIAKISFDLEVIRADRDTLRSEVERLAAQLADAQSRIERAGADERERCVQRAHDAAEQFLTDPHAYILHGPGELARSIIAALRTAREETPE